MLADRPGHMEWVDPEDRHFPFWDPGGIWVLRYVEEVLA